MILSLNKLIVKYKDVFYFKMLKIHLKNCHSVLDVGCGNESPLYRVKKTFYSEGFDGFKLSIEKSKKKKIHDKYTVGNIVDLHRYFKPKSFDAVIALDVIEHFEKKVALRLIKDLEKIAKKKVILLTPNGFYAQDAYDSNPYQVHKSGWAKIDLENLGYKTYGLRGIKYLRGDYATIKYKPWFLWGIVSFFSEPLLYLFPHLSYDLFAEKKIK